MTPIAAINSVQHIAEAYRTQATPGVGSASGPSFGELLGGAAQTALHNMRNAEAVTAQGVAGKADTQAVVHALTNAELTMQTVVAVRDKVLSAYSDVMRMAI